MINSANAVTLLRIAFIPFLIYLIYTPNQLAAALFFGLLAASDWLDGFLARTLKQTSDFGKFLDPLADKLLVISVLIILAVRLQVDVFSVIVLTVREFTIMGIRIMAAKEGDMIPASPSAKMKTTLQMIAIFFLLLGWPENMVLWNLTAAHILYYFSVILAVVSLGEYMWENRRLFKDKL